MNKECHKGKVTRKSLAQTISDVYGCLVSMKCLEYQHMKTISLIFYFVIKMPAAICQEDFGIYRGLCTEEIDSYLSGCTSLKLLQTPHCAFPTAHCLLHTVTAR